MWIIILMQMLFALSFIFLKKIAFVGLPILITAIRLLFSGVILFVFSLLFNNNTKIVFPTLRKEWKLILTASILNCFIANVLGQYGSKFLSASILSFIYNFMPFTTAIICFMFLNENISKTKWLGLCVGFSGFLPVLLIGETFSFSQIKYNLTSELFVIFAMLSSAIGWLTIKKLTDEKNISIVLINGITLLLGGLIGVIISLFIEDWTLTSILYNPKIWFYNLLIALNTYVICYTLYSLALRKYSATFVAFTGFLTTIFTAIFGRIFINEEIPNLFILSVIITTIGLFVFYIGEKDVELFR